MNTTDTDALTEVVRELIRDKGHRVHEWPDDEAAAYRDNGGFAPGRAAVEEVRVAKGVAAVKEAVAAEVRKAQVEALRETRNAFYRKYQFTPPLLDDGRNPSSDERVGARHAVNVAMAFIVEQMDKIEDGEHDSIVFPQNTTKEEDPR